MAKFYIVGGYIRDELLGVKSKDIDYAVEAESFADMRNAIVERCGEIYLETPEYFTIRANVPKLGTCDYVLCRKESDYTDGRRPDRVEVGTLLDDLSRRDFTVNAIARDEAGNYIDPFGGMEDIKDKVLKCVGYARNRFSEDYLRLLRAIRFCVTKNFTLDEEIKDCLEDSTMRSKIKKVSVERVREELYKAFKHNTIYTIELISMFGLEDVLFSSGLWLEPTLKGK